MSCMTGIRRPLQRGPAKRRAHEIYDICIAYNQAKLHYYLEVGKKALGSGSGSSGSNRSSFLEIFLCFFCALSPAAELQKSIGKFQKHSSSLNTLSNHFQTLSRLCTSYSKQTREELVDLRRDSSRESIKPVFKIILCLLTTVGITSSPQVIKEESAHFQTLLNIQSGMNICLDHSKDRECKHFTKYIR